MRAAEWVLGIAVFAMPARPMEAEPATPNLQPRTMAAYDAYVASAEAHFLARVRSSQPVAPATFGAGAERTTEGRIHKVADGLVHHWRSGVHLPGVRLERVIATAQHYDAYARMYAPVTESRLLRRDGDTFQVQMRVRGSAGRVTAVLEVRSVVRFERQTTSAYSVGASEDIREIVDAGHPHERVLPPGRGSGYLWRAQTFTRFVERAGGVDVELETIGLSRRFPPLLGWLIEPIARRLGRRSVERTLAEFALAVRDAAPAEPVPTAPGAF